MWIHLPPLEDGEAPTDEDNHSGVHTKKAGHVRRAFQSPEGTNDPTAPQKRQGYYASSYNIN